ncbi:hypothetical protein quinque_015860 [Culex quinquefasciatus]
MANAENAPPVRKRRYPPFSTGPFLVMLETTGTANLAPSTLAKKLIGQFGPDFVKAMPVGKKKMKRLVETLGVAHIGLEVPDDELKDARAYDKTKCVQFNNPDVLEIRRIKKKTADGGETALTTTVVTFSGLKLPTHVALNYVLYSIKPYNYPMRQCKHCWRFGHGDKGCKSKKRCLFCLEKEVADDHQCDQTNPTCVNCSGKHRADHKDCPKAKEQKEASQKRQQAYSQGPTDWFSSIGRSTTNSVASARPSTTPSAQLQPALAGPSTSQATPRQRAVLGTKNPKRVPAVSESQHEHRPKKRVVVDSHGNEDILPTLELNINEPVANAIKEGVDSTTMSELISKLMDPQEDEVTTEVFRTRVNELLVDKVKQYVGTLKIIINRHLRRASVGIASAVPAMELQGSFY